MNPFLLTGRNLTIEDILSVVHGRQVGIEPSVIPVIEKSRRAVMNLVDNGKVAYGITTGFGRFKDKLVSHDQLRQLQLNLVRSHAVGVGPLLDEKTVRAMLLVRANTLALGFSGVRLRVVEALLDFLNKGICPCIPQQGSLGASGDLSPLAHLTLPLLGEGEVFYQGEKMDAAAALRKAGLEAVVLEAKEGLALLNGTTLMVGLGTLQVHRAISLVSTADIVSALTLEALNGTDRAFDPRVHAARPHPRQIDCAAYMRALLKDSRMLRSDDPNNVQDAYTLRCIPQIHGAIRDSVAYAKWVMNIELNSANDNPLVFTDPVTSETEIISAGNFHGEPIALAMDYLKLGLTELGNVSERRIARLVDADSNGNVLPMFLTLNGGLESGMMIAQYSAASLASENKVFAHPASADTIPSSANTEDHVSMGTTATRHLEKVINHVETIVGIELLCAAQGIDLRFRAAGKNVQDLGQGTKAAYECIRKDIPFLDRDVYLSPLIEKARQLVADGRLHEAVKKVVGDVNV